MGEAREWRVHFVIGAVIAVYSARYHHQGKWTGGEIVAQDYDDLKRALEQMGLYRARGPQDDGAVEVWLDQ